MIKKYIITAAFLLAGCSTVVEGDVQKVSVVTPGVEGASCTLEDAKQRFWQTTSPGEVSIKKGDGPITILCKKAGFETGITVVDEDLLDMTFSNFTNGGLGFFVDIVSGASQVYPDTFIVWMKPVIWDSREHKEAWYHSKNEYEKRVAEEIAKIKNKSRPKVPVGDKVR